MNDLKKLTVSPAPHICARRDTASIMKDVVIALIPAQCWAYYIYGIDSLILTLVSVFSCVTLEWAARRILKRPQTISDWSAVVTGVILAMNLPVGIPCWMVVLADFFAIIVAKQLFGGLGQNFVNPALVGRTVLFFGYSEYMTSFRVTAKMSPVIIGAAGIFNGIPTADTVTSATPLSMFSNARALPANREMFLGLIDGSMGEISSLALIIGGVYLCVRKVISPAIPLAYMGSVMAVAALRGFDPVFHVCAGGVMLAAIFMATDYTTSPITTAGKIVYGIGCGMLTMSFRIYTSYPEGVSTALLLMNIIVPYIDRITVRAAERKLYGKEVSHKWQ